MRPRSPWEGIDLGCMLAREWFLPLLLLWMASAVPVMLVLSLSPMPLWLAGLLLWWLKPLYEPPLLHWLGQRLFGERPSWRELRGAWRQVVLPQLFANLTWRRLNPSRSFVMPVSVLERLRGKARSQRIQVLSRKSNAAGWLTIIGIHIEAAFEIGCFVLLGMLIPKEVIGDFWSNFFLSPGPLGEWMQQITSLLAMSLVAPFYVAGGFALYLTRRSELEGWDIELGLRRLAQRNTGGALTGMAALIVCGLLAWAVPTPPLLASEVDREEVRATIQEILADDTFGRLQEVTRWEPIDPGTEPTSDNPFVEWIGSLSDGIAAFGELMLWLAVGGGVAYLIYWFVTNRELRRLGPEPAGNGRVVPTRIAGLDLRPESLPDDPAGEAERLVEGGDYRAALSLLYRGALSDLIHRHALEIHEGATEGECRELVANQLDGRLDDCFSGLTGVWLRLAYGHRPPDRDQALALCRSWRSCFGGDDVHA